MGLPRGELFGLLGANGAGKTTAIAMVMRSLFPNAGGIEIEGYSVLSNFKMASKKLGVVTQHNTLWDKLSGLDHLRLFARLRGVEASKVEALVRATVAQMELGPYAERLAGQLSGGMKRKLVKNLPGKAIHKRHGFRDSFVSFLIFYFLELQMFRDVATSSITF
jgi:ABC-type multidrug transport system ATPase subunit